MVLVASSMVTSIVDEATSVIGMLVVSTVSVVTKIGAPNVVVSRCVCEMGSDTELGSDVTTLVGIVLVVGTGEPGGVGAGIVSAMDCGISIVSGVELVVVVSLIVTCVVMGGVAVCVVCGGGMGIGVGVGEGIDTSIVMGIVVVRGSIVDVATKIGSTTEIGTKLVATEVTSKSITTGVGIVVLATSAVVGTIGIS